jgi:hypothetical protein
VDNTNNDFNNIPELEALKNEINKSNIRLTSLTVFLILLGIGAFILINKLGMPWGFFLLFLFIAGMVYYVASFTLKYEYKEILEREIFPKILSSIQPNAKLGVYSKLDDDMKKSGFYFMPHFTQKWAVNYKTDNHLVNIALFYQPTAPGGALIPFEMLKRGLFVSITNVTFSKMPVYIYDKQFIPSLSQFTKQLSSDFSTDSTLSNTHTVISQPLDDLSKAQILELIISIDNHNTSISFLGDTVYILVSEQFENCFDPDNFGEGKLPTPSDYKSFINVLKLVQTITSLHND